MRLGLLSIGLVLLLVGLLSISISRTPVTIVNTDKPLVGQGKADDPQINITFTSGDKFYVWYSGGGQYINPDDIFVNVIDPNGNETTLDYNAAGPVGLGIIANYTGVYTIQIGAPGLISPSLPFFLNVNKIIETKHIEYPYVNLFPVGLSIIAVGAGICLWSAKSSKRRVARSKARGYGKRLSHK